MRRRYGIGIAVVSGLSACVQPGAEPQDPQDPAPPPVGPPACRDGAGGEPVTVFAGSRCLWELRAVEGVLVLQSLDVEGPPAARGVVPEVCGDRPCSFEGRDTAVGPIVVVSVASAYSEIPAGVWLGWSEGEALGFVDLWEGGGEEVWGDETPLGPSHALAPYRCGEAIALRAMPRTNAGEHVEPPRNLLAREGVYSVAADGMTRVGDVPQTCVRVDVPSP